MNSIFIIVLFLLELPQNALFCEGFRGLWLYALKLQIVANQSKIEQVVTTCCFL